MDKILVINSEKKLGYTLPVMNSQHIRRDVSSDD
jgi:hypothetical protein